MSKDYTGPAGDPAEGSRKTADRNIDRQSDRPDSDKPTPKTPEGEEGDTGGGKHPPVKSETGA